jgi:hypothetical protein
MITLNGEKELIRVESWEEIQSRPDFDGQLDPTAHDLASIIGSYVFIDKIACGLSNCRKPHGRGYLVVTKTKRVTNIGKDCGAKYFGVDFEEMSRKFDDDIADKESRERLWSFAFRIDNVSAAVARIRKGGESGRGADWAQKRSRALMTMNSGCPAVVVRRVVQMLKTSESDVVIDREATAAETARAEAAASGRIARPHYVRESAGHVAHLDALSSENDLREMLIVDVEENLKAFALLDIDQLTRTQLRHWSKWAGGVDFTLEKAEAVVTKCHELLRAENLAPFAALLSTTEEASQFKAFLASLNAA